MPRANILVAPPVPLYRKLFSDAADARLRSLGEVIFNDTELDFSTTELAQRMARAEVLVTSWRTARLADAVLERAKHLRLIAHSAGSVKFLLDEGVLARGIKVSTAGAAMVTPVAEMTVMLCMLMLRPVHKLDAGLRAGQSWAEMKLAGVGEELSAQTIGILGVGQIGRRVAEMLRAWDVKVMVYDPFLSDGAAAALGVRRCRTLDELMSACRIVSLHAPILPETRQMIGRSELAAMRDGSILINTARAWLVDTDALAAELRSGRLRCATDVFDHEPLPVDDPWRSMPNSLIMPHIAASTPQCFYRQGDITVDEVGRFLAGEPLRYEVTPELYATMA